MNKREYKQKYEVTPFTLAVLPRKDDYGNIGSYILGEQGNSSVRYKPSKVIDLACSFFGSNLAGRQAGTREISGMTSKLPISIDPSSGLYFFPTLSPMNPNCSWISHTHLLDIMEAPNQGTKVIFKNGQSIIVDVSYGSMRNQVNRTAQYRYVLDCRIQELQLLKK